MSDAPPLTTSPPRAIPRGVLLIFFISGGSALIDQIVWTRSLYRIFGVTAPAASTVLAAFMAGLAIGSYYFGKLVDRHGNGLRLYAGMELLIGLIAPLTPLVFRWLQPLYSAMAGAVGLDSPLLPVLRGVVCLCVLLPPTVLMGGTLPVIAKAYLRGQPGRVTAMLYSINTWGAVLGCFLCGYVLLGEIGETRSLLLAAAGNIVVAAWAWSASKHVAPMQAEISISIASPTGKIPGVVLLVSFINGFAALGLEVLWGRTIGLFTDASVYAFTGIIGVFLIGIALGSRAMAGWSDRVERPGLLLGGLSVCMSVVLLVAVRVFIAWLPETEIGGWHGGVLHNPLTSPLRTIGLALVAVLPVTLLSGACFPLMARMAVAQGRESGTLGMMYSVNTVGGIVGAAMAGFVLLPLLGDQGGFFLIAVAYLAAGAASLWTANARRAAGLLAAAGTALAFGLMRPGGSLTLGKMAWMGKIHVHEETAAGTVTALQGARGKSLLVNGVGMTVLCTDTKLIAHLPLAMHPNPKSTLVICFGMGTTFRSAARHGLPTTVVELQPAVTRLFGFYYDDAAEVLADPKNKVVVGDGRNYLLLSREKYSVIGVDPAPPIYSAGTVNLYTREFYELCRDRLDDAGVMCMWMPDASCTQEHFRLLLRTFRDVFPHTQVWSGPNRFGYYFLGSLHPLDVRGDRGAAVFENPAVRRDLREWDDIHASAWEWPARLQMDTAAVDRYIVGETRVLTDDRPYTEFPWLHWLGLGSNLSKHWMTLDRLSEGRR